MCLGKGSSHSKVDASKAFQVPGEAPQIGMLHIPASELPHFLFPAPQKAAAAAGGAYSQLNTRGKAAALYTGTGCAVPALPRARTPNPPPQARQGRKGLSETPSLGEERRLTSPSPPRVRALAVPDRDTALKGRRGCHLLLPAPRSAESKHTSSRPLHTVYIPATDTHPLTD